MPRRLTRYAESFPALDSAVRHGAHVGVLAILLTLLLFIYLSASEERFAQALSSIQDSMNGKASAVTGLGDEVLRNLERRVLEIPGITAADTHIHTESGRKRLEVYISANQLFSTGTAALKESAVPILDGLGDLLTAIPNQVCIEGHTDSDPVIPGGAFADNWSLSTVRATTVLRFLTDFHRVAPDRMTLAAYGETRPLAPNSSTEGKARNRRVTVVIWE